MANRPNAYGQFAPMPPSPGLERELMRMMQQGRQQQQRRPAAWGSYRARPAPKVADSKDGEWYQAE